MYLVVGSFQFKDDGVNRATEIMKDIVSLGRNEQGIHHYTFYPDPGTRNAWFLFEQWDSKALHDQHFQREEMQAMVPEFFDLLAAPAKVSYFDATLESTL